MTVWCSASFGATCRHIRWVWGKPCSRMIGGPSPLMAMWRSMPSATVIFSVFTGTSIGRSDQQPISIRLVQIRVLGPVTVIGTDGRALAVGSKRRRELLGRLVAAGGRVVSLEALIDDLWEDPPAGAVGAVRTFVSELRGAIG